mmetsp:Transcript_7849/g.18298  ORF Transcript_7849/g.18298 Transcript_7849/m.18298 type:complete len:237 (-) Transcript_7849:3761-4471(-)
MRVMLNHLYKCLHNDQRQDAQEARLHKGPMVLLSHALCILQKANGNSFGNNSHDPCNFCAQHSPPAGQRGVVHLLHCHNSHVPYPAVVLRNDVEEHHDLRILNALGRRKLQRQTRDPQELGCNATIKRSDHPYQSYHRGHDHWVAQHLHCLSLVVVLTRELEHRMTTSHECGNDEGLVHVANPFIVKEVLADCEIFANAKSCCQATLKLWTCDSLVHIENVNETVHEQLTIWFLII